MVSCSNCGRGFAKERIEKHVQICTNTKERQIYDIAKIRIVGTEAEELYKAGELYFISSLMAWFTLSLYRHITFLLSLCGFFDRKIKIGKAKGDGKEVGIDCQII